MFTLYGGMRSWGHVPNDVQQNRTTVSHALINCVIAITYVILLFITHSLRPCFSHRISLLIFS